MLKKLLVVFAATFLLGACASEPPPPPPPPPPAQAVAPPTFMVFFDWDRSNLSPQALNTIQQAAAAYKQRGSATITATGHTDTSGPENYNMALSLRRANAVKNALVQEGVPAQSITATGVGEAGLLVQTGDGVREPQNRRVEIVVAAARWRASFRTPVLLQGLERQVAPVPHHPGRYRRSGSDLQVRGRRLPGRYPDARGCPDHRQDPAPGARLPLARPADLSDCLRRVASGNACHPFKEKAALARAAFFIAGSIAAVVDPRQMPGPSAMVIENTHRVQHATP